MVALLGLTRLGVFGLRRGRQGRLSPSLRDSLRSPLTAVPATKGLAGYRVRPRVLGTGARFARRLISERVPGGQLFNFYGRAFERVWATGEPVA